MVLEHRLVGMVEAQVAVHHDPGREAELRGQRDLVQALDQTGPPAVPVAESLRAPYEGELPGDGDADVHGRAVPARIPPR